MLATCFLLMWWGVHVLAGNRTAFIVSIKQKSRCHTFGDHLPKASWVRPRRSSSSVQDQGTGRTWRAPPLPSWFGLASLSQVNHYSFEMFFCPHLCTNCISISWVTVRCYLVTLHFQRRIRRTQVSHLLHIKWMYFFFFVSVAFVMRNSVLEPGRAYGKIQGRIQKTYEWGDRCIIGYAITIISTNNCDDN